ncbi:FAD binding, berberine domain-containing protein [Penicillium ucsense]|uniref:FAD binding, berberine domain-containing protein n=1 Tax=Penicillium ucsense TaxID=2839758 RepID=A0A8J8W6M5_9EURO|nr:FAD binding, berberine domain-containing protein [Penicillium ucsense]KAF7738480.1 FAD binding, berberine domain-containing protein [Penicillium ucsense]
MIGPLLLPLLFTAVIGSPHHNECRCRPTDKCWPSTKEWTALNKTLNGNLAAVRPAAFVCHAPDYNAEACQVVKDSWSNSVWRSSQAGAIQWENWEAWPERDQSCYVESPEDSVCQQGRISLFSANVQSAKDIQHAVRFAGNHNLRLVIKNSGHDFLGRSAAPESLQILTHSMTDIEMLDNFIPKGGKKSEGTAMRIGAGVQLPEMYVAAAKQGRAIVAGAAHTVGAAGGYIQGGGHSPFGQWKGLASDNALEFEVVVADGSLVTANAYQNRDLFWALRGGGGGTFGVVTRVTIRTFEDVPVVAYNFNMTTAGGDPRFWDVFTEWHSALPSINDGGGSGYYYGFPNLPLSATESVSTIFALLFFTEKTSVAEVDALFQPLASKLRQMGNVQVVNESIAFPSIISTASTLILGGSADSTGRTSMLASRLYSKDLMLTPNGPRRLANAIKSIKWDPGHEFIGHVVAGGAVATNGETIDSAINPAWRRTISHLLFARSWKAAETTPAQQAAIIRNMTDVEIPILRSVEGEDQMGAYLNEANGYEPDFQASFWGRNYPRLYRIKQKWDPEGLFITRKGVGSEDWDDAGLCRRGH